MGVGFANTHLSQSLSMLLISAFLNVLLISVFQKIFITCIAESQPSKNYSEKVSESICKKDFFYFCRSNLGKRS